MTLKCAYSDVLCAVCPKRDGCEVRAEIGKILFDNEMLRSAGADEHSGVLKARQKAAVDDFIRNSCKKREAGMDCDDCDTRNACPVGNKAILKGIVADHITEGCNGPRDDWDIYVSSNVCSDLRIMVGKSGTGHYKMNMCFKTAKPCTYAECPMRKKR